MCLARLDSRLEPRQFRSPNSLHTMHANCSSLGNRFCFQVSIPLHSNSKHSLIYRISSQLSSPVYPTTPIPSTTLSQRYSHSHNQRHLITYPAMASASNSQLPEGIATQMTDFTAALAKLKRSLAAFVEAPCAELQGCSPLQRCEAFLALAECANVLCHMHLRASGADPMEHNVKGEHSKAAWRKTPVTFSF